MTDPITFEVPATCAHLGPGFGVLAAAVELPLRIELQAAGDQPLTIEHLGLVEERQLDERHDPVRRGILAASERFAIKLPNTLHVVAQNAIPPATGLGTQTACLVAGVSAAARLATGKIETPKPDQLLDLAVELGADPAHAAAALVGGLTAACRYGLPDDKRKFRVLTYPLHEDWRFVFACPTTRIATADARRILPPTLPHAATARTSGRMLGLLHALANGDQQAMTEFTHDEVHVPFRRRMLNGLDDALRAALEAGAATATVSGHGPAIVALTIGDESTCEQLGVAMRNAFERAGEEVHILITRSTPRGALSH